MVDNKDFDRIEPAAVKLTRPDQEASTEPDNNRRLVVVLIAVVVAAIAVVVLLPRLVEVPAPTAPEPEAAAPPVKESPFQEAQLAKARREAQEVLAQILEKQSRLENQNVQRWAADAFDRATALANEGDKLYRQRQFDEALARYRRAADQLAELDARAPQVLAAAIESGQEALKAGQPEKAVAAFERALAVAEDSEEARAGLARAKKLPQVLALIAEGDAARDNNQWQEAKERYRQAAELDPEHAGAAQKLAAVEQTLLDQRFNAAMSRGYTALEKGEPNTAETAFRRALDLKPGNPDARAGLNQAQNTQEQNRVRTQLERAKSLETQEQWGRAADIYQTILDGDDSVMAARIGLIRARARAELDAEIEKLLADPLRLSTPAVHRHGRELLADARRIDDPGPRLQRQTRELAQALAAATEPVEVTLRSDNATRVTLLRVGELGTFDSKTLSLKPGRYTAVGSREGYRDVRVNFEVDGSGRGPITVVCKEPV